MSLDRDLERMFERRASDVREDDLGWAGIEGRIRRAHRRRAAALTGTATAVVVALAIVVPQLALRDGEQTDPTFLGSDSPQPSVIETPSSSPSPAPVAAPMPETFVLLRGSAVELRSSATGKVLRTLVEPDAGWQRHNPVLSPDGQTVYYTEEPVVVDENPNKVGDECKARIRAVPIDGGEPETFLDGVREVAFSADGTALAYAPVGEAIPDCYSGSDIVVRDLSDGSERRWAWKPYEGNYADPKYTQPGELQLSPDGRALLFTLNVGDPVSEYRLLDVSEGDDILDARVVDVRNPRLFAPTFGTGSRAFFAAEQHHHDGPMPSAVFRVSLQTGEETRLFKMEPFISRIDFDASGRWMILSGFEWEQYEGAVWIWTEGEKPRKVATVRNGGTAVW